MRVVEQLARILHLTGWPGDPGNTPLVRINSLSDALGVEILGKAEVRTVR